METDYLSTTFAALADPTRRAILAQLALGESSVNQLAEPFDISLPAISRHLKVLENAGLITRGREAQWRPCKLNPEQLKPVDDWLDTYRRFWEAQFKRLDSLLQDLQNGDLQTSDPKTGEQKTQTQVKPSKKKTSRQRRLQ